MNWIAWAAVIAIVAFLSYIILVIGGLFKRNSDLTQEKIDEQDRQRQIENGVIKNNVKADNAISGSDLDKRVRKKYGSR